MYVKDYFGNDGFIHPVSNQNCDTSGRKSVICRRSERNLNVETISYGEVDNDNDDLSEESVSSYECEDTAESDSSNENIQSSSKLSCVQHKAKSGYSKTKFPDSDV